MHPFRTSPSIDDFDPRRSLSVSRHVRTTRHCSHRLSDEWLAAGYRNRRARDITRLVGGEHDIGWSRSEEHTSELQSLMRISYAVFCLKKKKKSTHSRAYQISSYRSGCHTALDSQ